MNGYVADGEPRDAAAIHADLERATPGPIVVIAATAQQFAVCNQRRSTEIVVYLEFLVGGRKGRAYQNSAPCRDVCEEAVLDAVVRSAIDSGTVCEEGQLARATPDNIATRRRASPNKALV